MRRAPIHRILLALLAAVTPGVAHAIDADVAKLQSCVERNVPKSGRQEVRLEMEDASGGRALEATVFWKPDERGQTRLLYRISAPSAERGSAFLFHARDGAHDIWTYLPEMRAVRRVTARGVSVPFFGSDFTYEDILELQVEARYARIELRPDAEFDGRRVRVLSARPAFEDSAYGEVVSFVDAETCVPLRVALYDRSGALAKEMRVAWKDVRRENDLWRPGVVSMRDLRRETTSRLVFGRGDWNADLPDRLFQPNDLAKGP